MRLLEIATTTKSSVVGVSSQTLEPRRYGVHEFDSVSSQDGCEDVGYGGGCVTVRTAGEYRNGTTAETVMSFSTTACHTIHDQLRLVLIQTGASCLVGGQKH